jgi:hypothetical protein
MPLCPVRLRGLLLCSTLAGGVAMGWLTILRLALAAWKLIDGWKSYTGAGLIAAGAVGYYASCPRVVMDGESSVWPSSELWLMILGLGSSLAVAGLKHALEKLKAAVGAEVYVMIAQIVRDAFNDAVKPKPLPDVFHVSTEMEPPAGGVGVPEALGGGMYATQTPSGAKVIGTMGCVLVLLSLCGTVIAAPPKAVINGPTTGTAGELLTLDASQSEGEGIKFLWRVQPDIAGRRLFKVCDKDPSRVSIASLPGVWSYTLVVSNAEGADLLTWVVTIPGTPQPTPSPLPPSPPVPPVPTPVPPSPSPPMPIPPGPGPAPTPTPPAPSPSKYGLDALVTQWAAGIPEADRLAYAGVCEGVSAVIVATPANFIGNPNEVATKVSDAIKKAIFDARITPSLKLLEVLGKLSVWVKARQLSNRDVATAEQWAVVLREVAVGLRGAK